MALEITVCSREGELPEEVAIDIMTSASFFGERDINLKQKGTELRFLFNRHCPNEYLEYLSEKYNTSFDYLFYST